MTPDNYDAHRERVLSALRGLITNIEGGKVVCTSLDFSNCTDVLWFNDATHFEYRPQGQTITLEVYSGIKAK